MSPRFAPTAAVALAALALGLGASACGGGGPSKEDEAAGRKALARWETGIERWRGVMLGALNDISLLLSNANTVEALRTGEPETTARLTVLERALLGCGTRIRQLGAAPGDLRAVRAEALRACRSLENGARLIREGVTSWRNGTGSAVLDRATLRLGDGQHQIDRVRTELIAALGSEGGSS